MPIGYNNTTDPKKAAQDQRLRITARGDELAQLDADQIADQTGRRNRTGDYLDNLYAGDSEGRGGYSDAEQQDIMGREGLDRLQQTGGERQANYLTPDEEAGMRGDTASQERFFNPGQMDQDLRVSQGRQDQAVDDLDQNLRKSVDAGALKQSETYRGNSRNILDRNQAGFDAAHGAVSKNVRDTIDPNAVTTSDAFLDDYNMSPEEQQDIVTGAGISAGTGYRAATGELQRRAAAAGAGPMGVAAYRARMEREGAGAAGDAMTQARIKASEAAAGRKLTGEELRTKGGQYLTDVKSGTEMRLGEDALAGQKALGDQALGQENTMETNRQGAEQFLTGANTDVAKTSGLARVQNTQNTTGTGVQQGQFNATTGTGIATQQDKDAASRAGTIATNRQGTEQYNQGQRYTRGMDQNNATSTRAGVVGNTRLAAQDKGRTYYAGQNDQANANEEAARNRQQQTFSTTTSGGNQATNSLVTADQKPGLLEKIAGTAIGAAGAASKFIKPKADGGVITEPTLAVVGEDGPEMVVPVGYRASAKVRPSMIPKPQGRRFYGEAA